MTAPEDLEVRMRAGYWPTVHEVAHFLDRGHTTVHYWVAKKGLISFRLDGLRTRRLNPVDVLALAEEQGRVRRQIDEPTEPPA